MVSIMRSRRIPNIALEALVDIYIKDLEQAMEAARETLEASADYHQHVDHAVVRRARVARLSAEHGCANPT